jgi:hypothetical protein
METNRPKPVELSVQKFTPEGKLSHEKVFVHYSKEGNYSNRYQIEYGVNQEGKKQTVYRYTPSEYQHLTLTMLHESIGHEVGVGDEDFPESRFTQMLKRLHSPKEEIQDPAEFCPLNMSMTLDLKNGETVGIGSFWYDPSGRLRKALLTPPKMHSKIVPLFESAALPEITVIGNGREPLLVEFNDKDANKQVKGKNFSIEKLNEAMPQVHFFSIGEYMFSFSSLNDDFGNPMITFMLRPRHRSPSQELILKIPLEFTYDPARFKKGHGITLRKLPFYLFHMFPKNLTLEY